MSGIVHELDGVDCTDGPFFCGHSIGFVFFGCAGVEKADGIDERMVAHGNNPR